MQNYKQFLDIWQKKIVLNEISQRHINKIKRFMKKAQPSDYAFGELFNNQWRVAVPVDYNKFDLDELRMSPVARNSEAFNRGLEAFQKLLKKYPKFLKLDLNRKLVSWNEDQTNPQTGITEERTISKKIGKFLSELSTKSEFSVLFPPNMNIFAWGNLFLEQLGERVMIISRHPIDILRMSDFQHMQSCHTEGGDYFFCAVEEAQGHGPIAYLVSKQDYEKVKNHLQDEEIFEDMPFTQADYDELEDRHSRNIAGIKPISRVRAKEFHNGKDGYSIALVDPKTYGTPAIGFKKAFEDWLHSVQDPHLPEKLDPNDFELMGGYYSDNEYYYDYFLDYFKDKTEQYVPKQENNLVEINKVTELIDRYNAYSTFAIIKYDIIELSEDDWAKEWRENEEYDRYDSELSSTDQAVYGPKSGPAYVLQIKEININNFNPLDYMPRGYFMSPITMQNGHSAMEAAGKRVGFSAAQTVELALDKLFGKQIFGSSFSLNIYNKFNIQFYVSLTACAKADGLENAQCTIDALTSKKLNSADVWGPILAKMFIKLGMAVKEDSAALGAHKDFYYNDKSDSWYYRGSLWNAFEDSEPGRDLLKLGEQRLTAAVRKFLKSQKFVDENLVEVKLLSNGSGNNKMVFVALKVDKRLVEMMQNKGSSAVLSGLLRLKVGFASLCKELFNKLRLEKYE